MSLPQFKFLIVDDYSNLRKLIIQHLKSLGQEGPYIQAETADMAMQELMDHNITGDGEPITFIISDHHMPGMTGVEFLKWCRSQNVLKEVPFLMLTTEGEKDVVLDAVYSGVSNYLIKPWEISDLNEKLYTCYEKHK